MAFNLRIPAPLESEARERCERLGISLNALVCVALDAYLRQGAAAPEPAATVDAGARDADAPGRKPDISAAPAKSKPVLTADAFPFPVHGVNPRPVLSAKPTKAERRALAQWHRDHPKG